MMMDNVVEFIKYNKVSDGMGGFLDDFTENTVSTVKGFLATELEKVVLDGLVKYSELSTLYFDYHTTIPAIGEYDVVKVNNKSFRVNSMFSFKYKVLALEEL